MKKIFVFLLLMVVSFALKAQYPIQQNLGGDSTIIYIKGAAQTVGGFINGVYTDTAAANLTRIRQYQAAQIFTTGDSAMWFRSVGATKWIRMNAGGGGSPTTDTFYWRTGGNYISDTGGYRGIIGTINNQPLIFGTNNQKRIILSQDGLQNLGTTNKGFMMYDTTTGVWSYATGGSGVYTAGNGLTLSGSQFKLGGTLSENTNIVVDNGFRMGFDLDPSDAIFSVSTNNSDTVLKIVNDNRIYLPQIFTVSSTTGRKVALIDTATGKVERIDPSALSGGSQTLQQVLTTGSTLTTNNTIASGANSLTFSNDRGTVVFDNTSNPLVKLNGTGSAALFQADSAGINKMRLMPRGQLALGDSVNLSIFIGHNSGLNYSPQGAVGNPPGRWNNALGTNALSSVTIGNDNIAIGTNAVRYLVDGTHNIGIGTGTLLSTISGNDNVAIGVDALINNNDDRNTAVGSYSQYLAAGEQNTSVGYASLYGTVSGTHTGSQNTALGYQAVTKVTSASGNTGVGYQSLYSLTTGSGFAGSNTAIGSASGYTTNGDYNLFLGNYAGFYSNENNAFYLHTLTSGISDEATGKSLSMFYGKFAAAGANQLRMNGKYGINTMPDSAFHVVGNSWLNGKLRITDGTQQNGYVLTSDANGNATWQAAGGGGGLTVGDPISGGTANRILYEDGSNNLAQSANVTYDGTTFKVQNALTVGQPTVTTQVGTLNIGSKDGEGKLQFLYDGTSFGYFKVNTSSGQVSIGSDSYPVTLNSSSTVTINNDLALNTTSLGLGRKMSLRYTGVEYGYLAIETNNAEFRAVSPNTYDFTWRTASTELMRLKESNGNLGVGISPTAVVHMKAGTATANTAPLKFTTGTSLTTAEVGAMEYTTPQLFFTNGAGVRQEIPQIQQSRVSSDVSVTSNTTLANVTGLTANVAASGTYRFEARLYTTSANTGGVKFAIGGTATATDIIYEGVTTDAGVITQTRAGALATTVGAVTNVTTAYTVITGTITVNAAGTLTVQFAQNASDGTASVVKRGSTFVLTEMN